MNCPNCNSKLKSETTEVIDSNRIREIKFCGTKIGHYTCHVINFKVELVEWNYIYKNTCIKVLCDIARNTLYYNNKLLPFYFPIDGMTCENVVSKVQTLLLFL